MFKGRLDNASTYAKNIDELSVTISLQQLHSVPGSQDPDQHTTVLTRIWDANAAMLECPERLVATGRQALQDHGWDQDVPLESANIFWRPEKDADPQKVLSTGQISIRFRTPMVEERRNDGFIGYAGVVFDFIDLDQVHPLHEVHHARLPKLAQAVRDEWRHKNLTVTHPRYGSVTPDRLTELKGRRVSGRKVELLAFLCDTTIESFESATLDQLIPFDKDIAVQAKKLRPRLAQKLLPEWQLDNPSTQVLDEDMTLSTVAFHITNNVVSAVSYDFCLPSKVDPDSVFCARVAIPSGVTEFAQES